jgi:hypothetical protein
LIHRAIILAFAFTAIGCANRPAAVEPTPTTQKVTDVDAQSAEPSYWLEQEAVAKVSDDDFETLWNAADRVSRDLLFGIDRQDRRSGLMTTRPTVSAQFFEPWRQELQSGDDLAKSSVATIRRTIYYEFAKSDVGYTVTPKVLIERQAITERRISGFLGRNYFRRDASLKAYGTRETDAGHQIQDSYWYAIGRDKALEKVVAERIAAIVG